MTTKPRVKFPICLKIKSSYVTDEGKKSRKQRMKQRWERLATKVPCRIHNSVCHSPRPRSNSQVKNFLLKRKPKTTSEKGQGK